MTNRDALNNRRGRPIWLGIATVTLLAGIGLWVLASLPIGMADPTDAEQVALGKRIYADQCASCHGAKLEGQPNWRIRKPDGRLPAPPHDETGHTWHHPDEHLFRITKYGVNEVLGATDYKSDMPAFAGVLGDAEVWAVLAFIKSTWPARHLAHQQSINERFE